MEGIFTWEALSSSWNKDTSKKKKKKEHSHQTGYSETAKVVIFTQIEMSL